jgi:hypothetical protein
MPRLCGRALRHGAGCAVALPPQAVPGAQAVQALAPLPNTHVALMFAFVGSAAARARVSSGGASRHVSRGLARTAGA